MNKIIEFGFEVSVVIDNENKTIEIKNGKLSVAVEEGISNLFGVKINA